ncbi:MAG: 50S ribosomal protein L10 [Deltaproteobacteria bacterium]|nr:50S ribosomal protein L10 [Deltaproteobacteria bacterium]
MDKQKKKTVVSVLLDDLKNVKAIYVTDFNSLPVDAMVSLRNKIRECGGQYKVVKNTLIKLAAKDHPLEKLNDLLVGNNGLGMTDSDPAVLAKVMQDFAKEQSKFVVKGGLLDGKVLDPAQVKALASLPSREILLSTMLGALQAVPTSLARVLAAVPQKLLYALTALKDKKDAGPEASAAALSPAEPEAVVAAATEAEAVVPAT